MQVVRRFGLEESFQEDPQRGLVQLEQAIRQEPTPEKLYSYAELAFIEGKKREILDPQAAMELFESSVTHAYQYLFDGRHLTQLNPYDPQFRGACDLYNGSLEAALRIARKKRGLVPGTTHTIQSGDQACEITVVPLNPRWHADEFERFEFVSDYQIRGLTNQFSTYGLGVPLIAVRKMHDDQDPGERYYPPGLSFPVTAFLRVMPGESSHVDVGPRKQAARLELHDPLAATDIVVDNVRVPLESDLTTPLAYFLNNGAGSGKLATLGLLRPDRYQKLAGMYMTQPYEPEKIPVVFVHGLWSDPTTWTDMFNDLRSSPEIRQRYQFWFYLYPTGQPFWISGARMRNDLAELRQVLDPHRQQPALDQMVLVGHSMGGLVSKLQTVDSGEDYWKAVSDQPFHLVKASPPTRQNLEKTFFFQSNPSIRRVVTIGTPHRGSEFANKYTQFLGRKLIFLPQMMMEGLEELIRENPNVFREGAGPGAKTSIDSLSPRSPLLPVLLTARHSPTVKYHNIVGVMNLDGEIDVRQEGTDGIVSFASAHLDNVESELVVRADHLTVHRHPLAVLEVRRILLEHLDAQGPFRIPRRQEVLTTSGAWPMNVQAPPHP